MAEFSQPYEFYNSWDEYFVQVADIVSSRVKCMSRKIGAVITTQDNSIISTGYNGPPRGIPHCSERMSEFSWKRNEDLINTFKERGDKPSPHKCPRKQLGFPSGKGLEYCIASHAERSAIVEAARTGSATKGAKIYMNCGLPCKDCAIEIINAGIVDVYCIHESVHYDSFSEWLFKKAPHVTVYFLPKEVLNNG